MHIVSNPAGRSSRSFRSPARVLGAAAVAVPVIACAALGPAALPTALLRDFNAFYCAGRAAAAGADPYLAEPVGACERLPHPFHLQSGMNGLTMPAPLPPYALAPFELLAHLPYALAALVWTLVIVASVAATVIAMRSLTKMPWAPLIAALALSDGYASACLGQVAPIAIAAIAVAAALAAGGRERAAGWVCALAMIEPHLALASCLGLFFRARAARLPLVLGGIALAALGVLIARVPLSLEYVRAVVPAHALSEAPNEKQFSLTHLVYILGVPAETAVRAGELQFAIMVIAGTCCGLILAHRLRANAPAVTVPVAFAVIGGPFIHIVQIAVASVAALSLLPYLDARARAFAGIALIALSVPWMQFVNLGEIFPLLGPVAAGVLAWHFFDKRPLPLGLAATASAGFLFALESLLVEKLPNPVPQLVAAYDPRELAEASWARYIHLVATSNDAAYELAKAPTVLGALIVAGLALHLLRKTQNAATQPPG